jgi:hypothetical protein
MNPLEWLIWAVIGLVIGSRIGFTAGGLTTALRSGRAPGTALWVMLFGTLGALLGGWLWIAEFGDGLSSFLGAAIFGLLGATTIQYLFWHEGRKSSHA